MNKKIAAALLFSSALVLPGLSSAQTTQTPQNVQITLPTDLFANRGACESALKQLRNTVRQDVVRPVTRPANLQGPAGAATNQVFNPLVKAVCTAVTDKDGKTMFKIVEG